MSDNKELINKFTAEVSRLGKKVLLAETPADAINYIISLIRDRDIKTVIKANSGIAVKLALDKRLAECGVRVIETSIVQWTLQLIKGKDIPSDEVAALISSASGQKVGTEPVEMIKAARIALKEAYAHAGLGITEADFVLVDTGRLITLDDEANARLASALPRLHLTLVDAACVVANLASATEMIKKTSGDIPGHKVSTFITHLTKKDIHGNIHDELFEQAQHPVEEIILLVNFR